MRAFVTLAIAALICALAPAAGAQTTVVTNARPGATPLSASALQQLLGGTSSYAAFTKDAQKQPGLFTLWRKDGRVFLELREDQFDKDFLLHIVNANGLSGFGIEPGQLWQQDVRVVRFERDARRVALIWKQTRFVADPGTPLEAAVRESQTDSTVGILAPAAEDKEKKVTILDIGLFLTDVLDLGSSLSDPSPLGLGGYRVDPSRSYFGPSKAFPKNVIIEADQTFASGRATDVDTVPDSRSLLMKIKYQFMELPPTDDYMPRLADERVGFWEDPHIQFGHPSERDNILHYILRWNIKPSDPTKAHSPAKVPVVYTLSNTIPLEYRGAIKAAVLEWNKAFERIGITDAVQVQDQPDDPNFDPDDARYNVIRWVTSAYPDFDAEALVAWDPRNGRIFHTGVLIDADVPRYLNFLGSNLALNFKSLSTAESLIDIDPSPTLKVNARANEAGYMSGKLGEASFGAVALGYGTNVPPAFMNAFIKDVVMHEVGHDFGLSHNFIGHEAYSLQQVQSKSFTQRNAIVSSVMEYAPFNLSPPGTPQGTYFNDTIGPYDYHVIQWGYAPVFNARTPLDEVPTLSRWAGDSDLPHYRFRGDEDANWNGHAVDPRVEPFMLSNDPIAWCAGQVKITDSLLRSLDARFPRAEQPWEDQRVAFLSLLGKYQRCTAPMAHYIAAEYLSRARLGDPGAGVPLTAISRASSKRAFDVIDRYLLSASAFNYSPETLRRLVYTERAPVSDFGYNPQMRHDVPVVQIAAAIQNSALRYMFSPVVLQRLADLPTKTKPGAAMTLTDLFTWTQDAIYRDLPAGPPATSQVHRNLQRRYAKLLAFMTNQPIAVYPYDAQALARYELGSLQTAIRRSLANGRLDLLTRAHLEAMQTDVTRALEAKQVL